MKTTLFLSFFLFFHFHTWAFFSSPVVVLLSTSKFFFNYRMSANVFNFMQFLREQGFGNPDILSLVPEMITSNPRNNAPGYVSLIDGTNKPNVAIDSMIDYRYEDVSVTSFLNIMRGRYPRRVLSPFVFYKIPSLLSFPF